MSKAIYPSFSPKLLHPRYWLNWSGIFLLYLTVQLLPSSFIYRLGKFLGRLSMRFMKRRVLIAKRNIALCFPDLNEQQRQQLLLKNFESTGLGVLETGMAWFWSDNRVKKHFTISGLSDYLQLHQSGQGILLIGTHFLNLELTTRTLALYTPGIGVYRPNNNPVLDYIQIKGRLKSNKYLLDRKDIRGISVALKKGNIIWYAPDHDYGPKNSVFVPFFYVEKTATTIGTSIIARLAKPAIIPFMLKREPDKLFYHLSVYPPLNDFPIHDEVAAATYINKEIEKLIIQAPEQYMWLHRRFKTRPINEQSLY